MSDHPLEQQVRALLSGGATAPTRMNNDATAQWAAQEAERQIKLNRQTLNARTALAQQRSAAAREQRLRQQEQRLRQQEASQATALEASVRRDLQANWQGSRADFDRSFPQLFDDYLRERTRSNQAATRRQSPAYGAI